MTTTPLYDAIVIGGGAAGLSAAVTLGRARRTVLVIDAGEPRNAPASGVHGFLTRDGMPPRELLRLGRAEAATYGVAFLDARATAISRTDEGFAVDAEGQHRARRLVVATGLVDHLPDIPGLAERWGRDAIHCPYCHGWEVRDKAIGILATGPRAMHQALLFSQWSRSVTVFAHSAPEFSAEDLEKLGARGIPVVTGTVAGVAVADDAIVGVDLDTGERHPIEVLVVGAPMTSRADVLKGLGISAAEHPMGVGTHVKAAPMGATDVDGVWVAGNVTDLMAQVVVAAAAGMAVGAQVNAHLVDEEVRDAVAAYRRRLEG